MENIDLFLSQFNPLSEQSRKALVAELRPIIYEKKEIILTPNSICKSIFLIKSGAVREFFIDPKGNDISVWFGFEGDFAVCLSSYISEKKGYTGLQAIEECEGYLISRDSLYKLYDSFNDIDRLGRRVIESYFVKTEEYHHQFHFMTATERFNLIMEEMPMVFKRVPLTYISSFLGISVETLSRIRSKTN